MTLHHNVMCIPTNLRKALNLDNGEEINFTDLKGLRDVNPPNIFKISLT